MNIKLYVSSDDPRQLIKQPQSELSIDCDIYDNCSLFNPVLILDYRAEITTKNYAFVAEWNRYYFINDMSITNSKRIILSLTCDVLMSFGQQLLQHTFRIQRSESNGNRYVPDNGFINEDRYDVFRLKSGYISDYGFADQNMDDSYMVVLGVSGQRNLHYEDIEGFIIAYNEPADWGSNWRDYYINRYSYTDPQLQRIGVAVDTLLIPNAAPYVVNGVGVFSEINADYGPIYKRRGT